MNGSEASTYRAALRLIADAAADRARPRDRAAYVGQVERDLRPEHFDAATALLDADPAMGATELAAALSPADYGKREPPNPTAAIPVYDPEPVDEVDVDRAKTHIAAIREALRR